MTIIRECHIRAQTEGVLLSLDRLRDQFVICLMAKLELQRRRLWATDLLVAHHEDCVAFCSGCVQLDKDLGS